MAFDRNLAIITVFIIIGTLVSEATSRQLYEASIAEKHEQWMAEYGRMYPDGAEKERRFAIFKNNMEFVEKFNNEGTKTYKLGLNEFSDMTNEEFLKHHTGYKQPATRSNSSGNKSFRYENLTDVPTTIDWRKQGAVSPIKNQGTCGCCWAFSAVAAVEGINKIKTGKLISLSEQQLVDCNTEYNQGCNGGLMEYAFEYIKQNGGIASEETYQYQGMDGTCNTNMAKEHAVEITGYEKVPSNSENDLLKAVSRQPVSVAIDASGQAFQLYKGGFFDDACGTELNHAVAAIGYGTTGDGTNYWLLKNSWGEGWGENGYMKIRRNVDAAEGLCGLAMDSSYPTV